MGFLKYGLESLAGVSAVVIITFVAVVILLLPVVIPVVIVAGLGICLHEFFRKRGVGSAVSYVGRRSGYGAGNRDGVSNGQIVGGVIVVIAICIVIVEMIWY